MIEYRRRLSVDILNEQFLRLQRLIPHGLRVAVFEVLINDLCDAIEENGDKIYGGIIAKKIKLGDFSPTFNTEKDS